MLKKLTKSSIVTNTSIYLLSNILSAATPFALLPILTRHLNPSQYGEVAMFQTFLGALSAFIGLNAPGAASRKYYDTHENSSSIKYFIAACIQILIASTAIALLLVGIFRNEISKFIELKPVWLIGAVLTSAMTVSISLRLNQWQIRKQAIKYCLLQVSQSAANMGLSLFLVISLTRGADGRIEAQILTACIFATIALILLHRDKLFAIFIWNKKYIKEVLNFGVPLIPHVAGGFLLASVDRFVINSKLGLEQAGIYMVAVQLSFAISIFFDSVNKAYVPWLFEQLKINDDQQKIKIVRFTYLWFIVISLVVTLAFFFGPWLVQFVAGERYIEAGKVFGWIALGQGFGGMYLMVTNYIFYSKQTSSLSLTTISTGLLNVSLLLVLTPIFGLKGAAISFSASMAIRFLLTWWIATKQHPMPWFDANLISNR